MSSPKSYLIDALTKQLSAADLTPVIEEIGMVVEVADGIARITGLSHVQASEMVHFVLPNNETRTGVVLNLEQDVVGAMILGETRDILEGMTVKRTKEILSIAVSKDMVGRVVNALGEPVDGKGPIGGKKKTMQVEKIAPGVVDRKPVDTPLQTGMKAIDAMIPIGRGQRELIIGDRQTGKTAVAIDTIINQMGTDVVSIYVAIGQKESKVAKIVAKLEETGAMKNTVVVIAGASAPASMQYLAPYTGATIGEFFMEQGGHALVVYDDLSKHAWAYRELSLLLRRPPGREAYPGDVFYLHSRLLERAAQLSDARGGGSLTALPIIETQAGDVSAYVPTNVISITDGQIFLETDLFYRGIRPALNVGISVSRVGSAAQTKAMKKVAGRLRLDLAQFRELEAFSQFSTDLDPVTKAQIERGRRTVEILKQGQYEPLDVAQQVAILYAVTSGALDTVPVENIRAWEASFLAHSRSAAADVLTHYRNNGAWTPEMEAQLKQVITDHVASFL